MGATIPGIDASLVYSLAAVGGLALALAAVNYVNLATARSGLRAREVALRKVFGAMRSKLLMQFLTEAVVLVAFAALIGLALAELALPFIDVLGGWTVRINYLQTLPMLAAIILLVGLGAGLYPAILLAAYQPAAVLASARTPAGGRMGTRLRSLLVLGQFASAIGLSICTLVINDQVSFLRNADRGFDRQGLIVVGGTDEADLLGRQQIILDRFRSVLGVVSVTISDREPNSDSSSSTSVNRPDLKGPSPNLLWELVGQDYFRTYGIHLVGGRLFDDAHRADDRAAAAGPGRTTSVVVNGAAVAALGYSGPNSALGQHFSVGSKSDTIDHVIIGVVRNVRFMSPHAPVAAQFYVYDTKTVENGEVAIRFDGIDRNEIMQRLQAAWQGVVPDTPFVAKTADERLSEFYQPDRQRAVLFSIGTDLAFCIACIGMYGLASFSTARRTREIGIRKTLGASRSAVLLLLVRQFVGPVVLANAIAWPAAWIIMQVWLSGFDQRIGLSPLFFIEPTGAALALSILTVIGQAMKVARAEPARALRYE